MFHTRRAARGGIALGAIAIGAALCASLAGCAPAPAAAPAAASAEQQVLIYPDVEVAENIAYGPRDDQRLDACIPADAETSVLNNGPRRAVISVHGGSWREGDKASPHWRSACEWLASEGFIAFSVNYAFAPLNPFPAAITDVQAVVEWLRQPEQVATYDYDPALIGAFGGSAGGNLVALLGASGSGAWDVGSRVAAVVELSGPIDLGLADGYPDSLRTHQLEYLGCDAYDGCATAAAASPHRHLDPSDPPVLVAHSTDELVPLAHAERLVDALETNGIEHEFVTRDGSKHSLAILDDGLRADIVAFLRAHL
jgi:acetyl esterase/lipase